MAQSGYTPILIYASGTTGNTPSAANMTSSASGAELALNYFDGKLFYKDASGNVQLLASKATSINVASLSFGTTGLTPNTATTGAITVGGTLVVGNGGTGLTTLAAGALTYGAGTSAHVPLAIGTAGQILTVNSGATAPQWTTLSGVAVTTFSGGTTGLTPSTATSGAITLAGTLNVSNGGTGLTSLTAGYIPFGNGTGALNSSSSLFFDGTNLGIGTSTPVNATNQRSLTINATSVSRTDFQIAGSTVFDIEASTSATNFVNAGLTPFIYYTNGSERMRIDSGGNVGIGVVPSAWLSGSEAIQNSSGALWQFVGGNIYLGQNYYLNGSTQRIYSTTGAATEYNQSGGVHRWYNAPSGTAGSTFTFAQSMTLDNSGNLLVGTTSNLASNGMIVFPSAGGYTSAGMGHSSGSASGSAYWTWYYNGGIIGSITQAGTTGVLYNVTSDYRLKTVIASVTNSGERIDALEPIEYDWNDGKRTKGFLAHKFAEVYPNSVNGKKDAVDEEGKPIYQTMQASSTEVMADLIAEIQSLRKRVAQLESK